MRDVTKLFWMSVTPTIASLVILSINFWDGRIPARNFQFGLTALAAVWLAAWIWGYADGTFRRLNRRRKNRRIWGKPE